MYSLLDVFIVSVLSFVIGWVGSSVYIHFQRERIVRELSGCTKNKEYKERIGYASELSRHGLAASASKERQSADLLLDKCLRKYKSALRE